MYNFCNVSKKFEYTNNLAMLDPSKARFWTNSIRLSSRLLLEISDVVMIEWNDNHNSDRTYSTSAFTLIAPVVMFFISLLSKSLLNKQNNQKYGRI